MSLVFILTCVYEFNDVNFSIRCKFNIRILLVLYNFRINILPAKIDYYFPYMKCFYSRIMGRQVARVINV
jgi:hypothetical protein